MASSFWMCFSSSFFLKSIFNPHKILFESEQYFSNTGKEDCERKCFIKKISTINPFLFYVLETFPIYNAECQYHNILVGKIQRIHFLFFILIIKITLFKFFFLKFVAFLFSQNMKSKELSSYPKWIIQLYRNHFLVIKHLCFENIKYSRNVIMWKLPCAKCGQKTCLIFIFFHFITVHIFVYLLFQQIHHRL